MRRPNSVAGVLQGLGLSALALGCTVSTDEPEATRGGVTHAIVVIERSAGAGQDEAVKAGAFAGFLSLPRELEPRAVLPIAGLSVDLPAAGACKKIERDPKAVPAFDLAQAELLDAGEVTLVAGGVVTTLAPRAFPSALDAISGVVYTTRDRAAEPLPAASRYTVATSGSPAIEPISVDLPAPAALDGVTVMGTPLDEVATLGGARAIDLGWNAGAPGDIVYVTLETDALSTVCAYRDESGSGTFPATAVTLGSSALSLHRLRATPFSSVGVRSGELRFDFEVSRAVTIE